MSGSSGPTSDEPPASPSGSAATGFAALHGTFLLLGRSPAAADVYQVGAGGVTRRSNVGGIRTVTAAGTQVVVGTGDSISRLRGRGLQGLGLGRAFSPALSSTGELAWVTLQGGAPTPGVTKPTGFEIRLEATAHAAPRTVYRTSLSLGTPVWSGAHTLVVAASDGTGTQVLGVDTRTGRAQTLAGLEDTSALALTVGRQSMTAATQDGQVFVIASSGDVAAGTSLDGSTPLCWLGATSLLVARGAKLQTVTVSGGHVGAPTTLGSVGRNVYGVYGASCATAAG